MHLYTGQPAMNHRARPAAGRCSGHPRPLNSPGPGPPSPEASPDIFNVHFPSQECPQGLNTAWPDLSGFSQTLRSACVPRVRMQMSSLTPSAFPGTSLAQQASLLGMLQVLASRPDAGEFKVSYSGLLSAGYSFLLHQRPYCPCPHRPDAQPVSRSTRQPVWSGSCASERGQPPRQRTLVKGTKKFHARGKFT